MIATYLLIALVVVISLLGVVIVLLLMEKKESAKLRQSVRFQTQRAERVEEKISHLETVILVKLGKYRNVKAELELNLSMQGMKKMNHGELFELIQANPHSGVIALSKWQSYGKAEGLITANKDTLDIIQKK